MYRLTKEDYSKMHGDAITSNCKKNKQEKHQKRNKQKRIRNH